MQGWGFVKLPLLLYHPYLVCMIYGMPSLHPFTFLMFFKSCIKSLEVKREVRANPLEPPLPTGLDNAAEIPRRYKNVVLYSPDPPFLFQCWRGVWGRDYTVKNYRLVLNFRGCLISRIFQTFAKIFQQKFLTRGVQCARAANSVNEISKNRYSRKFRPLKI